LFPGVRAAVKEHRAEAFPLSRLQEFARSMQVVEGLSLSDESLPGLGGKLGLAYYAARIYPEARQTLRDQGWSERELAALPRTTASCPKSSPTSPRCRCRSTRAPARPSSTAARATRPCCTPRRSPARWSSPGVPTSGTRSPCGNNVLGDIRAMKRSLFTAL